MGGTASDKDVGLQFSHLKVEICGRDCYYLYFVTEETEAKRSVGNFPIIPQLVSAVAGLHLEGRTRY